MKHLAVMVAFSAMLATSAPVWAQAPGQGSRTDIGGTQGQQTFNVRGHLIIWGAAGLDLDVIGEVTAGSLGTIRGTSMLVDSTAYPDVYVRTQRRRYLGVGFGIFQKTELFARYQEANNPAATVVIGQFGSSTNTFAINFDNYKDRLIELGLRRYFASPKSTREYFALSGGMKSVDPIAIIMQVPGGNVPAKLYGKSRVASVGLDFGVTIEFHKVGIFAESGFRYQGRLKRDDSELAEFGLESVNNTSFRLFMPTTIGLLIRF